MTAQPRLEGLAAVRGVIAVFEPRAGVDGSALSRLRAIGDGVVSEAGAMALASRGLGDAAWWAEGGRTYVLDGYLHDAEALRNELQLPADTPEVRLAAAAVDRWGGDAANRLRGAYALLAWDGREGRGRLLQDQLGGRSWFTLQDGPRWLVGTELRLLLEVALRRPAPDTSGVIEWLGGREMHDGHMLHAGVRRLGGGYIAAIDREGVRPRRYWNPRYEGELDVSREEAAALLRDAVRQAIRHRVRRGEKVGTLLSGGIDSTIIAAGVVHWCGDLEPALTAYSIVQPDDEREDESQFIDIATRDLGLPGWRVDPSGDGALWHALSYQDAFALPLVTPGTVLDQHLLEIAAGEGVTVMLDGQGGDEALGHDPYLMADLVRRGHVAAAWRLLHAYPDAGARPARWQQKGMLRRYAFRGNTPAWYDRLRPDEQEIFVPAYLRADLAAAHHDRVHQFAWKQRDGPRWWAHKASMLTELPDVYWIADVLRRRGCLEGIESRSPFLDVDLVETVLRLPPRLAFDPQFDRALARDALRGVLPEPIRVRPRKSNYAAANHRWLTRLLPAFSKLLGTADAEVRAYVDQDAVARLLASAPKETDPSFDEWGPQVWTLATAEMWLRTEAGRGDEVRAIVEQTAAPSHTALSQPARRDWSEG